MSQEFTEPATSQFFQVREGDLELQLHYNDCNPGDAAETVVLLHGSGPGASGWANFNRNIAPLADAGFRVLLLDCPGWGKSDSIVSKGSRSELNARTLKGLIDLLGLSRVHIVGNSMGAHTAVAFALANPDHVGRMVLMGGGTGGSSTHVPMPTEGIKLIGALYRDPSIENLKRMMQVFVYEPSALTADMYETRLNNILARRDHLENFVKSTEANQKQFPDVAHRLDEIVAPTLVVWGRNDRFVPLDIGLRLIAGIPNSELHVFNKCGHWAQWEHHERFNAMVIEFLGKGAQH